ncbi:MAG: carbamoyltransferase [Candidatus Omnitrophica bacterium]|nr:carbamoyltransferase [Candidatus Omnitrophota bacterium]
MNILGINAYHGDSSAAIVVDGKLIAAIEEERIRRIKHWAGFPSEAIKWCLSYADIGIKDVDYITLSRNPLARFHKKILRVFLKKPKLSFLKQRLNNYEKFKSIKANLAQDLEVSENKIKAKVVNVEHHRAHIASSFFVSPLREAAVVSIDGFGDFVSVMTGVGKENKIKISDIVEFPHSLGIFYTALTQFLGFCNYGDEYKVMGLSAYGEPTYLDKMREIVKLKNNGLFKLDTSYFLHDSQGVEMTWLNEKPLIGRLFSDKLSELLGKPRKEGEELSQRFRDIAASTQSIYEEAFFHILNHLYKKTGLKSIALAGGCIQNSLANGKIADMTSFENIYIPPAAYDAGGAIGSAFYLWNQILDKPREFVMNSPFWGPSFDEKEIKQILEKKAVKYEKLDEKELIRRASKNIADGKVVGWFQGRTECGPRALGNRSILADPRKKEMKDVLNSRIKKREWFRPFAPSILEEKAGEYFESSLPVPFMEKVYKIRKEKRELIPAICHIDGTGRMQSVNYEINPKYYDLIKEFENLTGIPIVLNTSLNENEPIVNTPQDALNCFLRTKMDVLVLENFYISCKQ